MAFLDEKALAGGVQPASVVGTGFASVTVMTSIRGVLIDISGVVYQGDETLPGSVEAIEQLRRQGLPFRFLTNTTSRPLESIRRKLEVLGVSARREDIFTPARAARRHIAEHDLAPHFLMRAELLEDFEGAGGGTQPAVIVGDAREGFTYESLNDAYRRLQSGAELVALASNRIFIDDDGEPSLDVGAFVAALEYASGSKARVMGKPAAAFFHAAAADMSLAPEDAAMIGDDAEFDVAAARDAGLSAFLVRTGKWRPGSAEAQNLPPETEFDNLAAVVAHILSDGG